MGLFKKTKRAAVGPFVSALVPAAGSSARMGGVNKLWADLCGMPLLLHTLWALQNSPCITEIIIATREDDLEDISSLVKGAGITKVTHVVAGGGSRADSVRAMLFAANPRAKLIAIHDGARPCVSQKLIAEVVALALKTHAAAPAVPVVDTLKETEDGQTILKTHDRSRFVQIQTPQCFQPELIKGALIRALEQDLEVTDDCAAVEAMGFRPSLSPGDKQNIKVTTPEDLLYAALIMRQRSG